ncbi:MAG: endonuclease/exonuclease/phosphatase family protein [Planctomycetaceae bacterium]|nr:endonuclease/exonuclease/phosphatase family protein [Planctomycetaceae bacterium]
MRTHFTVALFVAVCFFSVFVSLQADEPVKELRILTYNIHVGVGMDKKLDLPRIAKVISDLKPDLVALQEVDRFADRTKKVDQIEELKKLTGMHGTFGKTIPIAGGEYGIAVLSRFPIIEEKYSQLPQLEKHEDRGVIAIKVNINGKMLIFGSTHFCHMNKERRAKQAEKINELFADGKNDFTIIGGDFNAKPDEQTIKTLREKWFDATDENFTYSSTDPKIKIDYIFYRPKDVLKVKSTEVIKEPLASDHLPVLSVVELQ